MLISEIEGILEKCRFNYCEYGGCFDIAARKEKNTSVVLIKALGNVDSFQEEQSRNLKVLSRELEAQSILVGLHTRREALSDNIIYDRFDIPAVTPKTLENILNGFLPEVYRLRGGLFVEVDPTALREARKNADLSQSRLARKIGVTKKSIYEHESRKLKILYKNAMKIEKVLKTRIILPTEIKTKYEIETSPRSVFENRISRNFRKLGFNADSVYQSPFNMILKTAHTASVSEHTIAKKNDFMLLSDVEENKKQIQKNLPYISEFSKLAKKSAVIITREDFNFDIPTIREDELSSMEPRDIKRLIKNW